MHKRLRMGRRPWRCGMVATSAAVSLLVVSDVQGFAFSTLQLRALYGCPSSTSKQQQGQKLQEHQRQKGAVDVWRSTLSAKEVWSHRCATLASSSALESRRGRTALRMASEDLTSPVLAATASGGGGSGSSSSTGGGGAAATEAAPPETGSGKGLGGAVDGNEGDREAEKLRLTAEKLNLQAERLRLEVEKEQLILQAEKLKDKEALERRQDRLIETLREKHGRDEEMTVLVKTEIKKIDADFFMRLADVAEMSLDTEERDSLVALSEDVMRAVDRVDKARAVKVSKAIKESLDRAEEIERATRARAAAQALLQAQNASSIKPLSSDVSITPTNITDVLDLRGAPSSKKQDLRNLVGIRTGDKNRR